MMISLPANPRVSVLMPVYNAGKYLRLSLDSILKQTYDNLEVLICDDASTDDSYQILKTYSDKRITILCNETNNGYLKTTNSLLGKAIGELITFQDADDISPADRIEKCVNKFKEDNSLSLLTTNYSLIDKDNNLIKTRHWKTDFEKMKNDPAPEFLFCGATIMITRETLIKIGGYRDYFDRIGAEDYDWLYRIIEKYKAIHIEDNLYRYRLHESSVKQTNTNIKKNFSDQIALFLRQQRLDTGTDYIMKNKYEQLDEEVKKIARRYKANLFFTSLKSAIKNFAKKLF